MTRLLLKKSKSHKQATTRSSHSAESKPSVSELTFIEHLYELRTRLFWIVASLIITSAVGFQYKDLLVDFVIAPLHGEKLVYLTPGGGFSFIFTVCLYFGALLTIPVVTYHIYRFLQPVLGKTSRKFVALIILISIFLAASGAIFGYLVAIPAAIHFLSTFAGDAVIPNLTAESYLGFIVAYMLGLAALFQLPLLLYIFDHVRPFPPGALLTSQRFVIAGSVIAAAVITPTPDIINQLIVAGPIILIYQLGAIAVFTRRKLTKRVQHPKSATKDHRLHANVPKEASLPSVQHIAQHQTLAKQPPVQAVVVKQQPPVRRSIDGFSKKPAVRQALAVPERTARRTINDIQRHPSHGVRRNVRSLDGISVA